MKTILTDYWKLLDNMEDYLRGGVRRKHPEPPELDYTVEHTAQPEPPIENHHHFHGAAAVGVVEMGEPDTLDRVASEVAGCHLCDLGSKRQNPVSGMGPLNPLVMVIGEGPGSDEDQSGLPFVGSTGEYFDKWLGSIGLDRNTNCFITNMVKCRPPMNRAPLGEELSACRPFLDRQIALLRPKVLFAVGQTAGQHLLDSQEEIQSLRGNTYTYGDIPLVVTYHPEDVLQKPEHRPAVWEDLNRLKAIMERVNS